MVAILAFFSNLLRTDYLDVSDHILNEFSEYEVVTSLYASGSDWRRILLFKLNGGGTSQE